MVENASRFQNIEVTDDEGVSILALNQPASLNACTTGMLQDLAVALDELAADEQVRVVVLTGKGRAFCAGANLKEEVPEGSSSLLINGYLPIFRRIMSMEKPVIAAINGGAVGVGMSLALSCDLVLMAQDAYLMSPFTKIGLVPDGGANWLLVHQLGYHRAFEILAGAQPVPAERALAMGLANRVVAADELLQSAQDWGYEIARSSAFALAHSKKLMRLAATSSYEDIFRAEARIQDECGNSEFFKQAVEAQFAKSKK
jgi:2-(1,2-epoxy-1,2-dihydrophenyl)acetyl-CoA isomerase